MCIHRLGCIEPTWITLFRLRRCIVDSRQSTLVNRSGPMDVSPHNHAMLWWMAAKIAMGSSTWCEWFSRPIGAMAGWAAAKTIGSRQCSKVPTKRHRSAVGCG